MSIQGTVTERRFGIMLIVVFTATGAYGLYREWNPRVAIAWLCAAFVVSLVTRFAPGILAPLNKAWFHLGQLLGRIVSPIVLSTLFFGLLTPIALIARVFGRDELRLKRQAVDSYWRSRTPPGPTGDTFKNQF